MIANTFENNITSWTSWAAAVSVTAQIGNTFSSSWIKISTWIARQTFIWVLIVTSSTIVTTFDIALWSISWNDITFSTFETFSSTWAFITVLETSHTSVLSFNNRTVISAVTSNTCWNIWSSASFTSSSTWKANFSSVTENISIKTAFSITNVQWSITTFTVLINTFLTGVASQWISSFTNFTGWVQIALETSFNCAININTCLASSVENLREETSCAFNWVWSITWKTTITKNALFSSWIKGIANFTDCTLSSKSAFRTGWVTSGGFSWWVSQNEDDNVLFNNNNAISISIINKVFSTTWTFKNTLSSSIIPVTINTRIVNINTSSVSIVFESNSTWVTSQWTSLTIIPVTLITSEAIIVKFIIGSITSSTRFG